MPESKDQAFGELREALAQGQVREAGEAELDGDDGDPEIIYAVVRADQSAKTGVSYRLKGHPGAQKMEILLADGEDTVKALPLVIERRPRVRGVPGTGRTVLPPRTRKRTAPNSRIRVRAPERTEFLSSVLGGSAALARLLGVSRSQPTRWRKGDEDPSPGVARELVDLDHVMTRALMLWPERVANDWLTSANAYLDGARPIDVLQERGSAEVIDALDAATSGAFA